MSQERDLARELASEHYHRGDVTGWFDALYRAAEGDFSVVPWADQRPNPHLTAWCERESQPKPGARVAVVGCGLGDDAEYLASRGAQVTAFDIAPRAVAWCRERFPASSVQYVEANLLALPPEWLGAFDLVVEIYTVQALPLDLRAQALAAVASLVAPGGGLMLVCRGRDVTDPPGKLPWPLTREDLDALPLSLVRFEDFDDPFEPGKRRFRGYWVS